MKKILLFILILVAVIAGGAFWFLTSDKLNVLIAEQIEVQGQKFTEQLVTVEQVDMQLIHGAGTIKGLVLNNPEGYTSIPLFSMDEITLDINLASLTTMGTGKPITLDAIVINKPEILVEFNETGGSNIQEILDAINKNIPTSSSTTDASADTSTSTSEEPKIRVKKFVLAGVALRVDLTKLGNTTHKKILPDINLTDIGGEAGLPASELGGVMIKQALSAIWKEAKNAQKEVLKEQVKEQAKGKASELFDKWKTGK